MKGATGDLTPANRPQAMRRLWWLLWWLASGVLLWAVFWWWPIDAWLTAPFVGTHAPFFAWREHPALAVLGHVWIKRLIIGIGVVTLGGALLGLRQGGRFAAWRGPGLHVFLAMTLAPAWVGLLKRFSHHSCPWDLRQYGGSGIEYRLFAPVPLWAGGSRPRHRVLCPHAARAVGCPRRRSAPARFVRCLRTAPPRQCLCGHRARMPSINMDGQQVLEHHPLQGKRTTVR